MAILIGLFKLSFANLRINKLRSVLTVVGMIFGTGAVIATLSSNEGAAQYIRRELESMGTNLVSIFVETEDRGLEQRHVEYLKKYVENFRMLTSIGELGGYVLRKQGNTSSGKFIGVDSQFFAESKISLETGRLYDEYENKNRDLVGVIGAQLKRELFGNENAINEYIHAVGGHGSFVFKVIGVFRGKGAGASDKINSSIFIPPNTLEKIAPPGRGNAVIVGTLHDDEKSPLVRQQVRALLTAEFPSGVTVTDAREAIEKTQGIWKKQNLVGICLALISLVTGGVGIMNIMLLSVAQRKKEIGLRKAVGATESFVLAQFLMEAVMVCFFGGVAGILLGMFFGQQVAKMMGQWDAVLNISTVVSALFFAVLTGVVFGLVPAIRASRLDPYEALRG